MSSLFFFLVFSIQICLMIICTKKTNKKNERNTRRVGRSAESVMPSNIQVGPGTSALSQLKTQPNKADTSKGPILDEDNKDKAKSKEMVSLDKTQDSSKRIE